MDWNILLLIYSLRGFTDNILAAGSAAGAHHSRPIPPVILRLCRTKQLSKEMDARFDQMMKDDMGKKNK